MIERIKVIGLQRSGTNWIEKLLSLNLDIIVYDDPLIPFFKHAFPKENTIKAYKEGKNITTFLPEEYIKYHQNELFILVKKPCEKWIESIKKDNADLLQKKPELFQGSEKEIYNLLHNYYSTYHYYWESIKYQNLIIINYIDVLKDIDFLSNILFEQYSLKSVNEHWINISKVPHSKKFTNEDKKRYIL